GAKEEDCLDVGPGAVLGQQEDDMGAEAEFGVGVLAVDRQQVVALSGGQGEHLRVSFIRRVWSGTVLSPDYTGPVTFPLVGNHLVYLPRPSACSISFSRASSMAFAPGPPTHLCRMIPRASST